MLTAKKKFILRKVSFRLGCSSCRKPNLSDVFLPKPRSKNPSNPPKRCPASNRYSSSAASWDTNTTTFSSEMETAAAYSSSDPESDVKSLRAVQGFGRVGEESVAVEKDSEDPYFDFRRSMLQMILENEMYSKDDLKELLNCFLQLNTPEYHGVIVRAFTEIWNGVFSCH